MATIIGYGVDYSARQISGSALARHRYRGNPLRFVHRYLDFPAQQYPALDRGEVADLTAHGLEIEAIYEENTDDPAGGWLAGQRMGRQAVTSARAAGLPTGSTIYMCADAWLSNRGITVAAAMAFLDGARTVIAEFAIGAYGFADFIFAAAAGGHADRFWLCGTEIPLEHVPEWLDAYQWNNGREYVDGVECDLIKRYRPIAAGGAAGGAGIPADGGFLMALEAWQQERMFDRLLALSQGVDGQNFNGRQFDHEEIRRDTTDAKIDAIGLALAQLAEHDDRITLDPEQLELLNTKLGDRVAAEVDEIEAKLLERLDAMAAMLADRTGADKAVVLAALAEFYGVAVQAVDQ